ncbi:MAG: LysM peptidoglycan-binding domain-containing protein [Anaerolineaceae bacterium]|nr:LysM peptidoglycan-binding domain-containing protein [Anaerolineaceae bacterium]
MKRFTYLFVVAAMLLGLFFSPLTASPAAAESTCGDTYTVLKGDYIAKISQKCNVTVDTIRKANPEIKDLNLIYPGQVIRLKVDASVPTPTPTPTTPATSGTYTVVRGDYLSAIAKRFNTTVTDILKVNPEIKNASLIYVGQVIKLPAGVSTPTTGTPSTPAGMSITLSTRTAKVGAQVEVKVTGFPANKDVDFRLGKEGSAYSVAVDAKTDANGAATVKVTIPNSANVNEKWVVKVLTTELAKVVEITSPTITISN